MFKCGDTDRALKSCVCKVGVSRSTHDVGAGDHDATYYEHGLSGPLSSDNEMSTAAPRELSCEPAVELRDGAHRERRPAPGERELALSSASSIALCAGLAAADSSRAIIAFAAKRLNAGRYPVDASLLVVLVELLKACYTLLVVRRRRRRRSLARPTAVELTHKDELAGRPALTPAPKRIDHRLLVPCAAYTVTNNVFYVALHFVTPAVWLLLIQMRVVFLLLIYRLAFNQPVAAAQWIGAFGLICGVALSQVDQLVATSMSNNAASAVTSKPLPSSAMTMATPTTAAATAYDLRRERQLNVANIAAGLGLASFSSLCAATAGVYIELVLKSGGEEELWCRQLQLYVGSALISLVPFAVSRLYFQKKTLDITEDADRAHFSLLILLGSTSVVLSAAQGIATSLVIKRLDNLVRFQISAFCFLFTAVLCRLLFPNQFVLGVTYVFGAGILLYSMAIIERKKLWPL